MATATSILTRYLTSADIPALVELEHSKWEPHQTADADTLLQRIQTFPMLCIGAFCKDSGKALASLFMRPIVPAMFTAPTRWEKTVNSDWTNCSETEHQRSLFGISLSSNNANAVKQIFCFFYPRALKAGWKDIYLGSPIPGFGRAFRKNPNLSVWRYVHAKGKVRHKEPLDPQLRYYFKKGFQQIVSIQENYFPHAQSMDYGVILRGIIPWSRPRFLWRITPLWLLESIANLLLGLVGDAEERTPQHVGGESVGRLGGLVDSSR